MNAWFIRTLLLVAIVVLIVLEKLWFELWKYVKGYLPDKNNTKDLYVLYTIHFVSTIAILVATALYIINPSIVAWMNYIIKLLLALAYVIPIITIWGIGALFISLVRHNRNP